MHSQLRAHPEYPQKLINHKIAFTIYLLLVQYEIFKNKTIFSTEQHETTVMRI